MSSKRTRNGKRTQEIQLRVFSNEPRAHDYDLLQMLYTAASFNEIAMMHAKHKETGDIHRIIVGTSWNIEKQELDTFPLCKILESHEMNGYLAPDGKGGFIGEELPVAEEVVDGDLTPTEI